jgi:hypothetical protein
MRIALLALALIAATPSPSPQPTELPEIYHSVTRPLCSALGTKVLPALGMLIDDDKTIAKAPPYFTDYINMSTAGSDAGQDMAVLHLENLVTPLVQNTLALQKLLEDPSVFPNPPKTDDDKALDELRDNMLKVLAAHQASLDVINGFVQTQQMSTLQHAGEGWIQAMNGQPPSGLSTPNPMSLTGNSSENAQDSPRVFDDLALNAGIAPNPYEIDTSRIPGLAVGYNPISNLRSGLEWTQGQSKDAEATLSKTAIAAAHECGAR